MTTFYICLFIVQGIAVLVMGIGAVRSYRDYKEVEETNQQTAKILDEVREEQLKCEKELERIKNIRIAHTLDD